MSRWPTINNHTFDRRIRSLSVKNSKKYVRIFVDSYTCNYEKDSLEYRKVRKTYILSVNMYTLRIFDIYQTFLPANSQEVML